MHEDWVPQAVDYIGTDFQDGLDVDVVVDAHKLSSAFGENRFDIVISCSTYEHFQYPWIVTIEICRVLKPGGVVFVQTHQTFPLHAHPHDYWRFSVDGLRALFSRQVGFQVITADHEFPCKIVSERDPNTETLPSFLNACLVAEKIAHPAPDCAYAPEIYLGPTHE